MGLVSTDLEAALGPPRGRHDPVAAAYDGMSTANKVTFRIIIKDPEFHHAQVARALRTLGYDVDRKQVQAYREKLAIGRVTL